MAGAADLPTGFAADLVEAAAMEGPLRGRSGKQQLAPWPKIDEEQGSANLEIDAVIEARAVGTAFGPVLAELGITTVAVDGHGAIVKHYPDGRVETIGQT